jgi:hypothetical protein
MNTPDKSVNAWILLSEDDPQGTNYTSPNSDYQMLIKYGVYKYVDMLSMCFAVTVPVSAPPGTPPSYTIAMQAASHGPYTNQQYMDFVIRDSRKVNPNIKILITLDPADGGNWLSMIFSGDQSQWRSQATSYANNVVAYLQANNLDGFDIDWEFPLSTNTSQAQMTLVLQALRTAFNTPSKTYLLTLSPAVADNLDGAVVNDTVDFLNLQLYSGFTNPQDFINAGISKSLLAYGAKFEWENQLKPHQNAQNAYQGYSSGGYNVITQWRLNSNDYQFEQAQQMILYQLVYGIPGTSFDDTQIIGAAGNPPITQVVIRSGDVLDAIQATNTGSFQTPPSPAFPLQYVLLPHGGEGGTANTITISKDDPVVQVSGFRGVWYGWNCVLQITLKTRSGKVFGPYGTMNNATLEIPFQYNAPANQSIVAFSGSIVQVPSGGGGTTDIIESLNVSYA